MNHYNAEDPIEETSVEGLNRWEALAASGAHPLYIAALRADQDFQAALVAVYGAKRAGDARYLPDAQLADSVRGFKVAKVAADAAWAEANAQT